MRTTAIFVTVPSSVDWCGSLGSSLPRTMKELFLNLVTGGARQRIAKAQEKYGQAVACLQARWTAAATTVADAVAKGRRLEATLASAASRLHQHAPAAGLRAVAIRGDLSIGTAPAAKGAVAGLMEGAAAGVVTTSMVTGAVGALGSASTGAAISGLAGAAKSSATLAWLGGGSLATGGGGVAAGGFVVGALLAVPVFCVVRRFSRAEADRIEAECMEQLAAVERQVTAREASVQRLVDAGRAAAWLAGDLQRAIDAHDAAERLAATPRPVPQRSWWLRWFLAPFDSWRQRVAQRRLFAFAEARDRLAAEFARATAELGRIRASW